MLLMLPMMFLAETTVPPHALPAAAEAAKCRILAEYVAQPQDVTGFGWSSAARAQSKKVSQITAPAIATPTEPATAPDAAKLPEKYAPATEPAVQLPACGTTNPASVPKRKKNERQL